MNKAVISQFVVDTCTNANGEVLYNILKPYFERKELVSVSFTSLSPMLSSFFNSSFGELIENYGLNVFKKTIRLIDIPKNQVDLIRSYLKFHLEQ